MVDEWNSNVLAVDSRATLASLFDAQVLRTPSAIALVSGDEHLTYAEFDARANRLARRLITERVGPESTVGLVIRRSIAFLVAQYAIVKAGGAYVPVDPEQPAERVEYMLKTANPVCVVTTSRDNPRVRVDCAVLELDTLDLSGFDAETVTDDDRLAALRPQNCAYVMFTSGSTGRPKGVAVSHAAVVNHATWRQVANPLTADDAVLQKTPFTFDASVREFWGPLLAGARLVIASPDGHRDPNYLVEMIAHHRITTMHFVPSMLAMFVSVARADEIESLRLVLSGGEPLNAQLVKRLRAVSNAEIRNEYGPTEATISVTRSEPLATNPVDIQIGRPVANTQVFVLDSRLRPVGIGARGRSTLAARNWRERISVGRI